MSNYNTRSQFIFSNAAKTTALRAKVSFGASGAPTIVSSTGMGISSVTRNSAGDFTIALSRPFFALMSVQVIFNSGSSAPAAPLVNIKSDAVATAGAPVLEIVCRNIAAAAATDPASGEVAYIEILLNDSSIGY